MWWFWFIYLGIPIVMILQAPEDNPISEKYVSGEWSLARAWFCLGIIIVLWPILLARIIMRGDY